MNRILYFIALLVSISSVGQNSISVQSTFGTFLMSDFKDLMKDGQQRIGLNTEVVFNFPAYWGYEFDYRYRIKEVVYKFDMQVGIVVTYNSTGARLSAKDFSGEILQDVLLTRVAYGTSVRFIESEQKKFRMGFEFGMRAGETKLINTNKIVVGEIEETSKYRDSYNSTYLDTFWIGEYEIYDRVKIISKFGYELDMQTYKVYDPTSRGSYPDWTGLRSAIGLTLEF